MNELNLFVFHVHSRAMIPGLDNTKGVLVYNRGFKDHPKVLFILFGYGSIEVPMDYLLPY